MYSKQRPTPKRVVGQPIIAPPTDVFRTIRPHFKMSLLQHYYGVSNPQWEELVNDRLNWAS
jgi:hypothetical protein